jgi:heptosyltransferase-1
MTEILFIKTSSLGDVVHHMPAITDARRHFPDARLVWLLEEAFAPLARLHPGIDEVIPIAARRWRRALFARSTWREMAALVGLLRARNFDAVVDTQGLVRTAAICRFARGPRHGYDRRSVREPLAALAYDVRHAVARDLHAIERNRRLVGSALGYALSGPIDYGLVRERLAAPAAARPYAVLLHATARAEKEWPEPQWCALAQALAARGLVPVLPSGAPAEHVRSVRIAAGVAGAQALEKRSLDEVARLIAGASLVVGVDTGLLHLAAALKTPLVGLFVATAPELTGPRGAGRIAVLGGPGARVALADVLDAAARVLG